MDMKDKKMWMSEEEIHWIAEVSVKNKWYKGGELPEARSSSTALVAAPSRSTALDLQTAPSSSTALALQAAPSSSTALDLQTAPSSSTALALQTTPSSSTALAVQGAYYAALTGQYGADQAARMQHSLDRLIELEINNLKKGVDTKILTKVKLTAGMAAILSERRASLKQIAQIEESESESPHCPDYDYDCESE